MQPIWSILVSRFLAEFKKDIHFFGLCGLVLALLMLWPGTVFNQGSDANQNWFSSLFAEFVSFEIFAFIFLMYLYPACIATIFSDLGLQPTRLNKVLLHLEMRMTQIASGLVSFLVGFVLVVAVYAVPFFDETVLEFIAAAVSISLFSFGCLLVAFMVGMRAKPFDRWWAALLLMIAVSLIIYCVLLTDCSRKLIQSFSYC